MPLRSDGSWFSNSKFIDIDKFGILISANTMAPVRNDELTPIYT